MRVNICVKGNNKALNVVKYNFNAFYLHTLRTIQSKEYGQKNAFYLHTLRTIQSKKYGQS